LSDEFVPKLGPISGRAVPFETPSDLPAPEELEFSFAIDGMGERPNSSHSSTRLQLPIAFETGHRKCFSSSLDNGVWTDWLLGGGDQHIQCSEMQIAAERKQKVRVNWVGLAVKGEQQLRTRLMHSIACD
jgi:hypothetical protein